MIIAQNSARLVDALSASAAGETVSINAGVFTAPKGGFIIDKSVRLSGTHPLRNRIKGGTIFVPASPDDHVFRVTADNLMISDIIIRGPEKPGAGDGIHFELPTVGACIEFHRLTVWGVGRDGIHVEPHNGSANELEIRSCQSHHNGRHGVFVSTSMGIMVTGGYYAANGRCGMMLDGCPSAVLWHVAFEANQKAGSESDYDPQLYIRGEAAQNIDGCAFEDFARTGGKCAITIENTVGTRIVGCFFTNPRPSGPSRGIVFRNKCRSCLVELNTWRRIPKPVDIDATCTDVATNPQAIYESA